MVGLLLSFSPFLELSSAAEWRRVQAKSGVGAAWTPMKPIATLSAAKVTNSWMDFIIICLPFLVSGLSGDGERIA